MTKVLVCGSVSYDTITLFNDSFSRHISPKQEEFRDLAFHVSQMRNEFGGCAINICYNLKMLNCDAAPVATVGDDFHAYQQRLKKNNISLDYIKHIDNTKTAHYFITVDKEENQIVVFHAGAMERSHENSIEHPAGVEIGVISPDAIDGMKLHAKQFIEKKIPFIFDPGPITRLLDSEEIEYFIQHAGWVIANHHEWALIKEKTGLPKEAVSKQVKALIITNGSSGSEIYAGDELFKIPSAKVSQLEDPTGCGDAYRAGIIWGILNGHDWQISAQVASLMGAICAESKGAQNHRLRLEEFCERHKSNYGTSIELTSPNLP